MLPAAVVGQGLPPTTPVRTEALTCPSLGAALGLKSRNHRPLDLVQQQTPRLSRRKPCQHHGLLPDLPLLPTLPTPKTRYPNWTPGDNTISNQIAKNFIVSTSSKLAACIEALALLPRRAHQGIECGSATTETMQYATCVRAQMWEKTAREVERMRNNAGTRSISKVQ